MTSAALHADTSKQSIQQFISSKSYINTIQPDQGATALSSLSLFSQKVLSIEELIVKPTSDYEKTDSVGWSILEHYDFDTWHRIEIRNNSDKNLERYLIYQNATLDYYNLYTTQDGSILSTKTGGDNFHYNEREIASRHHIHKVTIPAFESRVFYYRLRTSEHVNPDFSLMNDSTLFSYEQKEIAFYALLMGGYLCFAIYHLFLYLTTKEPLYFLFVLVALSMPTVMIAFEGLLQPLSPDFIFMLGEQGRYLPAYAAAYLAWICAI